MYRAVANQLYGDPEQFQKVRIETVEYLIANRDRFSDFETDIGERLPEQLINCSWGGHIEITAVSKLYNVDISLFELSKAGELVTPFSSTTVAP